MKTYLHILFIFILAIFFYQNAYAREVSITANKTTLQPDEEIILTASISGFLNDETIFLKGAFFQDSTSNYFGYTKYNNDWIKNSGSTTSQKQIKVQDWDLQTTLKSDSQDTGFKGSGNYKVKLGYYYTNSVGNISGVTWSGNTLDISIVAPTNTPTPAPTVTPTPSITKSSTATVAVVSPPKLTSTPVSFSITRKPSLKITITSGKKQEVLGVKKSDPTPSETIRDEKKGGGFSLPPIFIIIGILVIVAACGILLFQEWKKQKSLDL